MTWRSRETFLSEVDINALSLLSSGKFIGDAFRICVVDQYRVVLDVLCELVVVGLGCKEEDAISGAASGQPFFQSVLVQHLQFGPRH